MATVHYQLQLFFLTIHFKVLVLTQNTATCRHLRLTQLVTLTQQPNWHDGISGPAQSYSHQQKFKLGALEEMQLREPDLLDRYPNV